MKCNRVFRERVASESGAFISEKDKQKRAPPRRGKQASKEGRRKLLSETLVQQSCQQRLPTQTRIGRPHSLASSKGQSLVYLDCELLNGDSLS
mmetsp:Transcript_26882/g.56305  ORF Transcript_26882/g.56305 Transcript_26882/m.56305 type:complete len:93 (+) Transcript_26882:249-527(+)